MLTDPPTPPSQSTIVPATLGQRIFASIVDALVLLVLGGAIFLISDVDLFSTPFLLLSAVSAAAYEVVCVSQWGQTLGKAALHIEVARASDPAARPTAKEAIIRYAAKTLEPLATVAALVGADLAEVTEFVSFAWTIVLLISIARHARKQGLHDQAASTVVIDRLGDRRKAIADLATEDSASAQ